MIKEGDVRLRVRISSGSFNGDLLVTYPAEVPPSNIVHSVTQLAEVDAVSEKLPRPDEKDCGVVVITSGADVLGLTIYHSKDCPRAA